MFPVNVFIFQQEKKKKTIAGSSVNVTCILVVHFWFINECNNESAGCWKESMGVFI